MEPLSSEEEIHSGKPSETAPVPAETAERQNGDTNEGELSPNHRRGTTIDFHDLSSMSAKPDKMYCSQSQSVFGMRRSLDGLSEEREITEFPTGADGKLLRIRVRKNGNERQITGKGYVETQTGLESVKSVVSRFGGSVDWRSQRISSPHKVQAELSNDARMAMIEVANIRREVAGYKMKSETIETSRAELLKELEHIKRHICALKAKLNKAEAEGSKLKKELNRAKHSLEVAEILVREGGKTGQLDMIKNQREAAVSELKSIKEEIKTLKEECASLAKEREILVAKAEESDLASKQAETMVEELTEELADVKKLLDIATVEKLETEDRKACASLAKDEECLMWKKEIKEAEEKLQQLNMQIALVKQLEDKLEATTSLLGKLNAEMEVYMKRLNPENDGVYNEEEEKRREMLDSKTKEIEEVKAQIEKVQGEIDVLRVEVSSLKTELEKEKIELADLRWKAELASVTVPSVEAEIEKTKEQIDACIEKEKEANRKIDELPSLIEAVTLETKKSKSIAQDAEDELNKVKEAAEPALMSWKSVQLKIIATTKEIEASKMSENIALAAIKALEESEVDTSTEKVTISFDKYFGLSKQGHEAAEQGQERVDAITVRIESAKESAINVFSILHKVYSELDEKKKELHEVKQKGHRAAESMMDAEQELQHLKAKIEEQWNSVELDKDEDAKPTEEANTEVTNLDIKTNGETGTDEDNKEEVKIDEAINGMPTIDDPKKGLLDRFSVVDSFNQGNTCCLSGRRSFCSHDGETTEYPSPHSPIVPAGKMKRNFFRKFWSKRKAQSVTG